MLKKIAQAKRREVEERKANCPFVSLENKVKIGNHSFRARLAAADWALIAECKLASPVKGEMGSGHTVPQLAEIYTANGATALSVLTDQHFNGCLADLEAVKKITSLPVLRKDFIIDRYQIYEARAAGADAILLIAGLLADDQLREYSTQAGILGLDCLVEVHTRAEIERVKGLPDLILGINNRDLQNFTTNLATTFALLPYCPPTALVISESGIRTASDAEKLKKHGVRGALVGEALVTAADIGALTRSLSGYEKSERSDGQ